MTNIKKGDLVKILSGKDRSETGKVLKVNTKLNMATVEGRNIVFRHRKPKKGGEKGQKLRIPMPMRASRLMVVCPHCKKPARIGHVTDEKGMKRRVCKRCGKNI
ncbi:MAG: 50S ribosomal protein L24 [Candidatus Doudnabacteria bacterium]|nr:50S ribosomal protein L24 [bacterium]MDZ4244135.1 50S ribosomal protein L24 [Candidatus Doudnabacteria bacterium]